MDQQVFGLSLVLDPPKTELITKVIGLSLSIFPKVGEEIRVEPFFFKILFPDGSEAALVEVLQDPAVAFQDLIDLSVETFGLILIHFVVVTGPATGVAVFFSFPPF